MRPYMEGPVFSLIRFNGWLREHKRYPKVIKLNLMQLLKLY